MSLSAGRVNIGSPDQKEYLTGRNECIRRAIRRYRELDRFCLRELNKAPTSRRLKFCFIFDLLHRRGSGSQCVPSR